MYVAAPVPPCNPGEEASLTPKISASLSCHRKSSEQAAAPGLGTLPNIPPRANGIEASSATKRDDVNRPPDSKPPSPSYQSWAPKPKGHFFFFFTASSQFCRLYVLDPKDVAILLCLKLKGKKKAGPEVDALHSGSTLP